MVRRNIERLRRLKGRMLAVPRFMWHTVPAGKLMKGRAIVHLRPWIMSKDEGRFPFILSKYLEQAGFNVAIKTNVFYYSLLAPYKKLLLQQRYLFLRRTPIFSAQDTVLLVTERGNKQIKFVYGYNVKCQTEYDCIAPFPMHPVQVENYSSVNISELRRTRRKVSVFFSGNVAKEMYSRSSLENTFHVASRFRVIDHIFSSIIPVKIFEPIGLKDLYDLFSLDEKSRRIVLSKVKTPAFDWLPILAKSDFFLAPPGVEFPWCHNSIEAMAVGTIPILQYAHLLSPMLENKKNCLVYNDLNELPGVLEAALNMPEEEIEGIRAGCIEYYEKNLSPTHIVECIKSYAASERMSLTIAVPFLNPPAVAKRDNEKSAQK